MHLAINLAPCVKDTPEEMRATFTVALTQYAEACTQRVARLRADDAAAPGIDNRAEASRAIYLVARAELSDTPRIKTPEGICDQDLATILAALRYYQENGQGEPDNRSDEIQDIATDGDEVVSLDADGIDDLCERLTMAADRRLADDDATARNATMALALAQVIDARDHCAEHGEYPADTVGADQCFDDWAADLATSALEAPTEPDAEARSKAQREALAKRLTLKATHGSFDCSIYVRAEASISLGFDEGEQITEERLLLALGENFLSFAPLMDHTDLIVSAELLQVREDA